MGYKTCAICGQKVQQGDGMYYGGRLIHKNTPKNNRAKTQKEPERANEHI